MTFRHAASALAPSGYRRRLTRRSLLAAAMAGNWSATARSACRDKAFAQTEAALVTDVAARLKTLGIGSVMPVGTVSSKNYYRLDGSKVRLFFAPDKGPVISVGVILSQPAPQAETDLQTTLAAFILSRTSGLPEALILNKLKKSLATRTGDDRWVENYADTTAVVTRSRAITMILIGRIDCG